MSLKATIQKKMSNKKIFLEERYKSAKFSFVVSSFVFFLNYLFVSSKIDGESFFIMILPFTFIFFVISLTFLAYLYLKREFQDKIKPLYFTLLLIILSIIIILLSTPFFFEKKIFF